MNSKNAEVFTNDFDDWVCGICREGDATDGLRTLHECKRHEFHTSCLTELRVRDVRCPLCRFPVDAQPSTQSPQPEIHRIPFQTGLQYAISRFPNMFRQLMPDHDIAHRFRPRVGKNYGPWEECAYCTHPIEDDIHAWLYDCMHRMHSSCVIDNMYQNGVDDRTGKLFCPTCHEGDRL